MAQRPPTLWFLLLSGGGAVASAKFASWLLASHPHPVSVRLALVVLPLLFFAAFVYAELRYVLSLDELQRRVFTDSLAIAFPAAVAFGFTVEALQRAGFLPGVGIGDVWPWMGMLWIPALLWAQARYR